MRRVAHGTRGADPQRLDPAIDAFEQQVEQAHAQPARFQTGADHGHQPADHMDEGFCRQQRLDKRQALLDRRGGLDIADRFWRIAHRLIEPAQHASPEALGQRRARHRGQLSDPLHAQAMQAVAPAADVVIMAAAVADFRPAEVAEHKIKKADGVDDAPVVRLVRNPDILAELVTEARGT